MKQITPINGAKRHRDPGHGFWIDTDKSYCDDRRQVRFCSVCGNANPRPTGEYCRWCGSHLDQEPLDLTTLNGLDVTPLETKSECDDLVEVMIWRINGYENIDDKKVIKNSIRITPEGYLTYIRSTNDDCVVSIPTFTVKDISIYSIYGEDN